MASVSDDEVDDDDMAQVVRMSKAKYKGVNARASSTGVDQDKEPDVERSNEVLEADDADEVSDASADEAGADEANDEEARRIQALAGKGKGVSMRPPPKRRKMSKNVLERKFKAEAKKLSSAEVSEIVQFLPFKRLVKDSLDYDVTHASSTAVQVLMEAAVSYLHDLYEESWKISTVSSNKKTLMMRHVSGLLFAKRISHLPQDGGDDDDDDDDAE